MKQVMLNIETASLPELLKAYETISAAIEEKRREEKKVVTRQIRELAKTYNLDIEDILYEPAKVGRSVVKPKYRHPDNPALTWTGRGRTPVWIEELQRQGISKENLRVSENEAA